MLVDKETYFEIHHYLLPKKKSQSFVIRLSSFFSTFKYFALFEVIRLLKLFSLLSNSVLVTKLACFRLAANFSDVSFLNSGVVICLS